MKISSACRCLALSLVLSAAASAQVITRVSIATSGAEGNGDSFSPSLSQRGHLVVFYSKAANLVPNDLNAAQDVFLHDRIAGTTVRVSVSSGGVEGNGESYNSVISGDGRFVAYNSAYATSRAPPLRGSASIPPAG